MKTFIIILFAYLLLNTIITKIPPPKKKKPPRTVTKTVVKVVPRQVPDLDEIEYQRDRLNNLYTISDSIESQLHAATKPEKIELLTRKQLAINAQIRKAQKIIQKELEK